MVEPREITILAPWQTNKQARKTILPDGGIRSADNVAAFRHRSVPFGDIRELAEIVRKLQNRNALVVRGGPASDRQPLRRQLAHTSHGGKNRGDEGFTESPRAWLAVDIDGAPLPALMSWAADPEVAVDYVLGKLPEPWCDTSYVWSFTASHGLEKDGGRWLGAYDFATVRCRVWYVLDRPVSDDEAVAMLRLLGEFIPGVDVSVGRTVQMIYTARPLWVGKLADPLEASGVTMLCGLTEREYDELAVPVDLKTKVRWAKAEGAGSAFLPRHPDAVTAVQSIGLPVDGVGPAALRAHIMSAVRHLTNENPQATAADIEATIRQMVGDNREIIEANLSTGGRSWPEIENYLGEHCQAMAQWFLDRAGPERGADGFGGRKQVKRETHTVESNVLRMSADDARADMGDQFADFTRQATNWARADDIYKNGLKKWKRLDKLGEAPMMTPMPPDPPVAMAAFGTGSGKTREIHKAAIEIVRDTDRPVVIALPRHALAAEQAGRIGELSGLRVQIIRGRDRPDPEQPGKLMCHRPDDVKEALKSKLPISRTLCKRRKPKSKDFELCPLFDACGYQRQQRDADIYLVAHESLFSQKMAVIADPAAVFIDESPLLKNLIGTGEKPRDVTIDRLRTRDVLPEPKDETSLFKSTNGGENTATLAGYRATLLDHLDALEPGLLSKQKLAAAGITAADARDAMRLEYMRMVKPTIGPETPPEKLQEALADAAVNADVVALAGVWRAIADHVDGDGADLSGRVELAVKKDGSRVIRTRGMRPVAKGWQVPTMICDATADADLLRYVWPELEPSARVALELPHVKIRQLVDRSLSHSAIAPNPKSAKHKTQIANALKLRVAIIRAGLEYGGLPVLAIMPKATEAAIRAVGALPNWLHIIHHGDVTGVDQYGDVRALFSIGRALAPSVAVSRYAMAMTGDAVLEQDYMRAENWIPCADGMAVRVNGWKHPDPTAEQIRWQITEAAVLQGIGRARGVNRTAETPLDVHIWADIPLPELGPVEPFLGDELAVRGLDWHCFAAGCWLESVADAALAWAEIVTSERALKRDRERSGTGAPFAYYKRLISKRGLCSAPPPIIEAHYQKAGPKQQTRQALFLTGVIDDPQAWLEERLGPLSHFEIVQPSKQREKQAVPEKPVDLMKLFVNAKPKPQGPQRFFCAEEPPQPAAKVISLTPPPREQYPLVSRRLWCCDCGEFPDYLSPAVTFRQGVSYYCLGCIKKPFRIEREAPEAAECA